MEKEKDQEEKLEESRKLLHKLEEQSLLGITRSDFVFLMVNALAKLHPEVYQDPLVIKFIRKAKDYEKAKSRAKGEKKW